MSLLRLFVTFLVPLERLVSQRVKIQPGKKSKLYYTILLYFYAYCDINTHSIVSRSEAQKFMKRLYAFKTIKQILGLIDKSAGYSDVEKRRALDLALENNFVTSLTSLVVTGQEDPIVVATREPSHDERRHRTPSVSSQLPVYRPDIDGVGPTSVSFSFPNHGSISGSIRRDIGGSGRSGQQEWTTTTTTQSAPPTSVGGCKLVLYSSTYYRGQAVEIMGDVTDLSSLNFGDKLASLKVEGSCRWEIFQGKSQHEHRKLKIK